MKIETKEGIYKMIIQIHKETGQGFPAILKLKLTDIENQYIDELVEEGLIKECDTGGSIGHPLSNIFIMSTKGYNVWEDEDPNEYSRHKGRYLYNVRLYLGVLDKESITEDQFEPSMLKLLQDSDFMENYTSWLKRNKKELEVMKNLDDFYAAKKIEFSEEEISWIKSREWYEKNNIVLNCLKLSNDKIKDEEEIISINNRLIELYKKSGQNKHKEDLEKSIVEIEDSKKRILLRKKINGFLNTKDENLKIQDIL